jgi:uncharacterized protein (TIGR03437 family)
MRNYFSLAGLFLIAIAEGQIQISPSAYRVLGQASLQQDGLNGVQGTEFNQPLAMALDPRGGQVHIYVADPGNSRILGWADTGAYQLGDPPGIVLGQPAPFYSNPSFGNQRLNNPAGMAVDPATGNLYVADTSDNRILRFPSPFANPNAHTPTAVIGQADFTTNGAGVSSSALNQPISLAFDSAGNLWVSDTGNNRILRFPFAVLDGRSAPQADLVLGQKDFVSAGVNAGGAVSASGFNLPDGVAIDPQNNLYVADLNNARVLKFTAPVAQGSAAAVVYGQTGFGVRVIQSASSTSFRGPGGIAISASGVLYVSVPAENRVLVFPAGATTAATVFGQPNLTSSNANFDATPLASANGLFAPRDVKSDPNGNVYIVDTGNNRVLEYASGSRSGTQVWGQASFTGNGPNQLKPASINTAFKMVIDYSQAPFPLYVSDTGNHRILIWKDSTAFQTGSSADLVIGQPTLFTGVANVDTAASTTVTSATSLFSPRGIALDPSGNLYVADYGNNRVLRYPRPVNQAGRITPDIVIGQPNFTSVASGGATSSSLRLPSGVAVAANGELFVADSGNNRVLEFVPNLTTNAAAAQVFGQPSFNSGTLFGATSAQTLNSPVGIFVDLAYDLYVADTGNNRVVVFSNTAATFGNGAPASLVFGQPVFTTSGVGRGAGGLAGPADLSLDSSGNIYVSDNGNNRVVVYPSILFATQTGTQATGVIGQPALGTNSPDWDTPDGSLASGDSLFGPLGVYVDRQNTVYVGDAGNNRLLQFLQLSVVENAASGAFTVPVAAGSLSALYASNIAPSPESFTNAPLPYMLSNRQVVINDTAVAPLLYAGPALINFQVPTATPAGQNRIAVRTADTGELIAGGPFLVASTGPGIFVKNAGGQGAILNQDYSLNGPSNPAPRGSTISVYGTGQGPVSPTVPDGNVAPSAPLSYTLTSQASSAQTCLNSPQSLCAVFAGSIFGTITYSGLAPSAVGEWQINVTIPSSAPTGAGVALKVVLDGSPSNTVLVAIK